MGRIRIWLNATLREGGEGQAAVPEGCIAFVEELPGANTQGATLEEARADLQEAVMPDGRSAIASRKRLVETCRHFYNQSVDTAIDRIVAEVCGSRPDVAAVYLFGSVARDAAGPGSDVDVAVLFTADPPARLTGPRFTLEGDLERALGRPVDLVVLNDGPVDLRSRVLRDGRLLIDRDRSARIAFEVRTRNEAFDLQPILTQYRAPRGPSR